MLQRNKHTSVAAIKNVINDYLDIFGLHLFEFLKEFCIVNYGGGSLITQSFQTLQALDYSPPGSSGYVIFQARMLQWVAISFSN